MRILRRNMNAKKQNKRTVFGCNSGSGSGDVDAVYGDGYVCSYPSFFFVRCVCVCVVRSQAVASEIKKQGD